MIDIIQKGYYEVHVDGVKVGQKSRPDKANALLVAEQLKNLKAKVEIVPPRLVSKIDMKLFENLALTYGEVAAPPVVGGSAPVLSGFTIEDGQRNRVYFNSSVPITASNVNSFKIANESITTVHIETGLLTGHYFTLASDSSFWKNNTIRYEGNNTEMGVTGNSISDFKSASGSIPLNDFTLEYITNNIAEPTSTGTTRYLDVDASGTGDGLSEVNAYTSWATAIAALQAGDILFVKVGRYTIADHVILSVSSTETNPIKIIGYKTSPTETDITSRYYSHVTSGDAPELDETEMPLIDGENLAKYGLWMDGSSDNVIVKNIQFEQLSRGITAYGGARNIHVERVLTKDMYGSGASERTGLSLGAPSEGSYSTPTNYRFKDCYSINNGAEGISIYGSNNAIIGSYVYCDDKYQLPPYNHPSGDVGTDYFIYVRGSNSMVINCDIRAKDNTVNSASHGLSNRGASTGEGDFGLPAWHNLWQFIYVGTGSTEGGQFRNPDTKFCVMKDISIVGFGNGTASDGKGIVCQSGAQYNIAERITIIGVYSGLEWLDGSESGTIAANNETSFNVFRNSLIQNVVNVMESHVSTDVHTFEGNRIDYVTVNNANNMMRGYETTDANYVNTDNKITNSILNDVTGINHDADDPQFFDMWSIENSNTWDIWETNGTPVAGTGNISIDPNFVNLTDYVPQATGLNIGTVTSAKYDFLEAERRSDITSTIGLKQI